MKKLSKLDLDKKISIQDMKLIKAGSVKCRTKHFKKSKSDTGYDEDSATNGDTDEDIRNMH